MPAWATGMVAASSPGFRPSKLLHRLRFARVSTRPRHPQADTTAQAFFGPAQTEGGFAGFAALVTAALPDAVRVAKTPIEVWLQDQARVGQLAETAQPFAAGAR